jgi:hypothetical protein
MSLEVELVNSLQKVSAQIGTIVQQADGVGNKLRPALEDTAKATKKVSESAGLMEKSFSSVGHHMGQQLRRVAFEAFGVTAVFGMINDKIAEHKKKLEEAGNATYKFAQGSSGLIKDNPGMRKAIRTGTGLPPEEALASAKVWIKAGGKKDAPAVSDFARNVLYPSVVHGLDSSQVSHLAGMANKAGLNSEQTRDAIGSIINSKMSDKKIDKLEPSSMRRIAMSGKGQWRKFVKTAPVDDIDEETFAIRRMEALQESNKTNNLEELRKKRLELSTDLDSQPGYDLETMGLSIGRTRTLKFYHPDADVNPRAIQKSKDEVISNTPSIPEKKDSPPTIMKVFVMNQPQVLRNLNAGD